ncbi:MAG: hypothetical protein JWO64_2096 [Hyphomicrobiales bacterium]|nr:hypothetical protein [Hyphomicrobiales bacterium]
MTRTSIHRQSAALAACKPIWRVALLFLALAGGIGQARAYDAISETFLVNVRQGTPLSDQVYKLSMGSYELSGGGGVDFRRWYGQNWTEMRVDFMTQVTEGVGILWGLSSGEWGPKYRIAPGFKLGLILQSQLTPLSSISISFTSLLGGRLREKSCEADYGDIGGVQSVNCRLAASTMQPSDTLKYLVNMKPPDRFWVGLRYQARF